MDESERDGGMETGSVDSSETRSVMMKKDKWMRAREMGEWRLVV